MANESGFRAVINQRDEAKVVSPNIENNKISNLIGGGKCVFYLIKVVEVSCFQKPVPTIQTALSSRVLPGENLELFS